ncbi:hypothetical protein PQQ81_26925 [Paraburkholderia strydomiana]|uniref:hypothetical protein n=1 Tax=Paraburkholderia strydomiana TaxID=1245417 RepID=UPI0038BC35A5
MKPITLRFGQYDTNILVRDLGGKLDAASRPPSLKQQSFFPAAYPPGAYDLMVCAYQGDGDKNKRSDEVIDALVNEMSQVLEAAIAHDSVVTFADLAQWVIGRRELHETELSRLLRGADVRFEQDADAPGVPSEWQVELSAARERRRKTAGDERAKRQQTEQGEQAGPLHATDDQANGIVDKQDAESGDGPKAHSLNLQPKSPIGVPSPEIAAAFAGMNNWDEKAWKTNLASAAKTRWLIATRLVKGKRGGAAALWNPVTIAIHLADTTAPRRLDRVFEQPAFREWCDEWRAAREYIPAFNTGVKPSGNAGASPGKAYKP